MPYLPQNMPMYAQNAIMGEGQGGGLFGAVGNKFNSFGNGLNQTLSGIFGNSAEPYREYGKEYEKYNKQAQSFQNPFYNAGVGALGDFQGALGRMKDPTEFINNLMNNYQESPWAKFQQDQAQRANNNMASASGLLGSTPWQQAGLDYSRDISSQDMDRWLQHVLGVNTQYLSGQSGLVNNGQTAGNNLSRLLEELGQAKAGAAYGQQAGEDQDFSNTLGGLVHMFTG